jgi:hypothetical protein
MVYRTQPARTSATACTLGLWLAISTRGREPPLICSTRRDATVTSRKRFSKAAVVESSVTPAGSRAAASLTLARPEARAPSGGHRIRFVERVHRRQSAATSRDPASGAPLTGRRDPTRRGAHGKPYPACSSRPLRPGAGRETWSRDRTQIRGRNTPQIWGPAAGIVDTKLAHAGRNHLAKSPCRNTRAATARSARSTVAAGAITGEGRKPSRRLGPRSQARRGPREPLAARAADHPRRSGSRKGRPACRRARPWPRHASVSEGSEP